MALSRSHEQMSRHRRQPGNEGEHALQRTRQVVTAPQLNGELRHQAGRELGGAIHVFEPGGEQGPGLPGQSSVIGEVDDV